MPIAMSKDEWGRINEWTKLDREDPEVVRRREYVKYLDNTSHEMTKSWPNSLENVNKRNEELRQARIQVAEQANTKFYNRYLKRKKEEQERLMYSARDVVFKNKDAPKLLLSAVIETAVQKERLEQIKFLNERRKEAMERKKKDDEEVVRKAKEWKELNEERKKRRFEVNKKHQQDIIEQSREMSERNRIEYETELNLQKLDILKANEEMEAIKDFEEEFKAEEKARIFNDMERSRAEARARKQEQEARDKMDNRLIDVLLKSRAKIEQKRKQTELDVKNEKLRVLENISQRLESGDAARELKEQAMFDKAVKEKLEADEARRQAQLQKEERFRRDKIESREQFLRDQQQRLHEFHTTRQWEIMNRFKNVEIYDDFLEKQREEKERKIKEYREEILRLWKEREDREAKERAESRYFYGELAERKLRDADNKLLTHAAQLLQEAQHHQRPPYALQRAIDAYCKLYRLYPMPDLPKSLAEHFVGYAPRDGSQPDAAYSEPPPPPPPRQALTPASPSPDPTARRDNARKDGLQPLTQSSPTKQKKEKVEENIADYKRAAPANGLQRREEGTFLPPISVVPCTSESCRCELKMGWK
ncbi:trichohyalin-like [Trichoplusia ni]|uniref:Trichohyalin-like n=1 Tax=Trichoplusia ni TaxID=7111 RepID=A0A7E5VY76_TRINI|nr:trichohyalin-like [Trichoplusia ni]